MSVLFNRLTCTIVSSKENLEVLSNAFACRVLEEPLIEKKKKIKINKRGEKVIFFYFFCYFFLSLSVRLSRCDRWFIKFGEFVSTFAMTNYRGIWQALWAISAAVYILSILILSLINFSVMHISGKYLGSACVYK